MILLKPDICTVKTTLKIILNFNTVLIQCHSDDGEISDVENDLDYLYGETGQFQLYIFSYGTEMPACKEKWWCLWTSEVCHHIKVCLLNVKDPMSPF